MTYQINFGRHQLKINLKRKRGRPKKTLLYQIKSYFSLLSETAGLNRRYAGSPATRVLRRILENKKTRQIFGVNLVFITLVTGTAGPSLSAFGQTPDNNLTSIVQDSPQITTEKSTRYPLETVIISQGYHHFHRAIDFKEATGAPIYPIMEGRVIETGYSSFGYGYYLMVDHGSGFKSLYAHLSRIKAITGDEVDKNTVIGLVGTTGRATGSHLHLEVYDNSQAFNPLTILN